MGSTEWTVIGTGFAILAVGGVGYRLLHGDLAELRRDVGELCERMARDVGELRERMARLEGLFEGFTRRDREA